MRQWHAYIMHSDWFFPSRAHSHKSYGLEIRIVCGPSLGGRTTLLSTYIEEWWRWPVTLSAKWKILSLRKYRQESGTEAMQSHPKWMWTLTSWHRFIVLCDSCSTFTSTTLSHTLTLESLNISKMKLKMLWTTRATHQQRPFRGGREKYCVRLNVYQTEQ